MRFCHLNAFLSFLQDELNILKIGIKDEMDQFPSLITNVKDLKRKKELENLMSVYDEGKIWILFNIVQKKVVLNKLWHIFTRFL